ncbi:Uncharacterised protein [Vibrio cholerae]|nr:Uncharacterised protein [Vibrio cholerae]CSC79380.1 Uncharacterised protein [Vibrio cholerae]CSI73044.1 Uncharacterised protein [Vibrio cholerae]
MLDQRLEHLKLGSLDRYPCRTRSKSSERGVNLQGSEHGSEYRKQIGLKHLM